jgi:hypothetical protein
MLLRNTRSLMKKVAGFVGMIALVLLANGCTSIQNASLRSYQGPLPMGDLAYVNAENYGSPIRNTK